MGVGVKGTQNLLIPDSNIGSTPMLQKRRLYRIVELIRE
jgi:hypothetical protein